MGLGLSLVKKIVESYNGDIWVEDRVKGDHEQGSNFVVLLQEAK
jgi:signal transduction histidine kinase